MLVAEVMTSPAIVVSPYTPIGEIAATMLQNRLTALPVVDEGRLVGIVTESDLVARGADADLGRHATLRGAFIELIRGKPRWLELGVRAMDLMTKNVTTAHPDETLSEVADRMITLDRRHLPVVEGDRVVGVVSRIDLLRGLVRERAA
jgi:CBS domain-containing protein